MLTLQDILAFEDDPELLSFRCPQTGWLVWPALRHEFLGYLIFELAYQWPALVLPRLSAWQRLRSAPALVECLQRNAAAYRRGIDQHPIMIFASGILVPWEGQLLNRLSDHFALATAGQSVVWENVEPPQFSMPNGRINPDVFYTLPYVTRRFLTFSLTAHAAILRVASALTKFLADRAVRLFGLEMTVERKAWTKRSTVLALRRYPFDRRYYEGLYTHGRPRLVLLESACYGHLAPAVLMARAMGIPVAEYQHAFVTGGYRDYNFAPTILASNEYRKTLPDYFLSYGRWWNDRFNAPVEKVAVGNPYRSERLARVKRAAEPSSRSDVVVLAKAEEADRYLKLAVDLDRHGRGRLRVVFRAKPSDRVDALDRHDGRIGRVIIDKDPDFYATLASADVVVGGPSTTLAEAFGIARRVFIWDDAAGRFQYPEPVFERFNDAADLCERLAMPPDANVQTPSLEDVWASNWRERYSSFVSRFLGR